MQKVCCFFTFELVKGYFIVYLSYIYSIFILYLSYIYSILKIGNKEEGTRNKEQGTRNRE